MESTTWRVGVDIGGTFTDIVASDGKGHVRTRKVPSTADDYARAIVRGMADLLDGADIAPGEIGEVVHGTTVATNAILERKGAPTGLLTTDGFRDVLEIRRLRMPEMYNLLYRRPAPLIERYLRRGVRERISAQGTVVTSLDETSVRREIAFLLEQGVESVAVCLLNSYANAVHEQRIGVLLESIAPGVSYSLSCDVLPEVREYERTSTTVINAYVRPVVERYVRSLLAQFAGAGIRAPVFVMQSNGGLLPADEAAAMPVQIVESGPAAGAIGASLLAQRVGVPNAIAFDMGGTTAKATVIEDGVVRVTSDFEVGGPLSSHGINLAGGGYALKVPVIEIAEVGAGGGSIISVDAGGSLQIGPRSAGAVPGPVAYGQGGTDATVTDANVVLGYLNPCQLAGGAVRIDARRAAAAVRDQVASPLGLEIREAAWAAHMVANATMMGAIKAVTTNRGRDPRDFTLIAFGGSGPVHAAGIARLLEIRRVLVPPAPGLFSAAGLLVADHARHAVQTFYRPAAAVDVSDLDARLTAMEDALRARFVEHGYEPDQVEIDRSADLRYVGQGYELTLPLPSERFTEALLAGLKKAFVAEHRRVYGHGTPDDPLQFVNLRLAARVPRGTDITIERGASAQEPLAEPPAARPVYFGDAGLHETPVVRRADLSPAPRCGPLIVEEYDATVVVPPDCLARLDHHGVIVIEFGR